MTPLRYRIMKRNILTILLCVWGSIAIAGTSELSSVKEYKSLDKLLVKGKLEKGLQKSRKYRKEAPKEAGPWYYESFYYLEKAKQAKTLAYQNSYTKKSLAAYKKARKRDPHLSFFKNKPQYANVIPTHLSKLANRQKISKPKQALAFYQVLAEVFADTTSDYLELKEKDLISSSLMPVTLSPNDHSNGATILEYTKDSIAVNREKLLTFAESLVGTPYKWAGESKKGLDCSGFNLFVYKNAGVNLPHNAQMQSKLGKKISLENAKKGDLIFFGSKTKDGYRASHTGMIYKNDQSGLGIIHCVSRGVTIDEDAMKNYWMERVLFVKRIIN